MLAIFPNVLSKDECGEIIYNTKDKLEPARVITPEGSRLDSNRTAQGVFIYNNPPVIQKIKKIVSKITQLPIENQEPPHIVKYEVGGEYKEHVDFLMGEEGKNRKHSCLFYLNEDVEGGDTYFPKLKTSIKPTIGTLVKWDNLSQSGIGNINSVHAGTPVTKNKKWILIIWVRESKHID